MKANELMIGDWVCTEHDSTPRQIDWIRTGEVGLFWNKVVTPPYLVPIPLTPEILEKNFPTAGELAWWPVEDGLHCESRNTEDIMVSGVFRFVHQLQNAIRLVGIEREIKI